MGTRSKMRAWPPPACPAYPRGQLQRANAFENRVHPAASFATKTWDLSGRWCVTKPLHGETKKRRQTESSVLIRPLIATPDQVVSRSCAETDVVLQLRGRVTSWAKGAYARPPPACPAWGWGQNDQSSPNRCQCIAPEPTAEVASLGDRPRYTLQRSEERSRGFVASAVRRVQRFKDSMAQARFTGETKKAAPNW